MQCHGTSNTGNLARRCFKDPTIFADALQIDCLLVTNIATILAAFKSKARINLDKLELFCWKTYCLQYELYPWARMSPTCHKLLKHGCSVDIKIDQ